VKVLDFGLASLAVVPLLDNPAAVEDDSTGDRFLGTLEYVAPEQIEAPAKVDARADIYALEAACDCFVSLHRSEGFGLAVAECMYLGKPVISTNWSATAEFVSHENGCPVRAPLIALDRNHGPYAKGSFWADPDPAHAAEWMHTLFTNRTLAAQLGTAAQATIRTRFAPAVIGARYRQRLESISTF
jgi:glycosyltransferase involved in cell wall biosynthesis